MVCDVTVGRLVKISFSATADNLQEATENVNAWPDAWMRARLGQEPKTLDRLALLLTPAMLKAGIVCSEGQLENMLFIVVTAATDPGKAGIVCSEVQPLNMLLIVVTAATDPGKAGIVCSE